MMQRATRTHEADVERSDDEKRAAISDALAEFIKTLPDAADDAWAQVIDVFADATPSYCVFSANLDNDGAVEYYRIEFAIAADGTVKFKGDPIEVARKTSWEPVPDDDAGTESRRPRRTTVSSAASERAVATDYVESLRELGITSDVALRGRMGTADLRRAAGGSLRPVGASATASLSESTASLEDSLGVLGRRPRSTRADRGEAHTAPLAEVRVKGKAVADPRIRADLEQSFSDLGLTSETARRGR